MDTKKVLQYYSAMSVGADTIITRNGKHFSFSSIPVMDCGEYLMKRG